MEILAGISGIAVVSVPMPWRPVEVSPWPAASTPLRPKTTVPRTSSAVKTKLALGELQQGKL